jgi:hypothetical protein
MCPQRAGSRSSISSTLPSDSSAVRKSRRTASRPLASMMQTRRTRCSAVHGHHGGRVFALGREPCLGRGQRVRRPSRIGRDGTVHAQLSEKARHLRASPEDHRHLVVGRDGSFERALVNPLPSRPRVAARDEQQRGHTSRTTVPMRSVRSVLRSVTQHPTDSVLAWPRSGPSRSAAAARGAGAPRLRAAPRPLRGPVASV